MKNNHTAFCKKILAVALVVSMLKFSSSVCFAGIIDNLDINNGIMEVSGYTGDNEMVLVEIFKKKQMQNNYLNDLIYIFQKNTENGKYKFEFNILNAAQGETGDFIARLSDFSGKTESRTFYFYTEEETDVLREAINGHIQNIQKDSEDIEWLENYFIINKNNLIPSYIPFDDVFENNYTANFSELYSYVKKCPDNATMRASIRNTSLLTMIGNSSADRIYELLESNGTDLQISGKQSYITYTQMNEDGKKSVANMLHKFERPYTTENDFQKSFDTAVIITKLGQINGTTACENVLDGYPEYFGGFDATNNHYKAILKGISNKTIDSIADITDILGVTYEENNNGFGGGGNGGGENENLTSFKPEKVTSPDSENYDYEELKSFTDLGDFEWAAESINYLRDRGVINGYSDGIFAPADNVSRAQLCKMLCLALKLNSYDKDNIRFNDVNKKDWYYDYVSILSALGIVNGTGNNLFEPESNVTREDMAVMVYRAMKLKNIMFKENNKLEFSDANLISDYAVEAVSCLSEEKILNGNDGKFNPKDNANRAEMAKFIHSVCIKYGGVE